MKTEVNLLTMEERACIPEILAKRAKFKKILTTSIEHIDDIFSNCILISGKPGSGKTTLTMQILDELKQSGRLHDTIRTAGHVTPTGLYSLLKQTTEDTDIFGCPSALVMDDVDCLGQEGCLELLKAAFDTRNPKQSTNRRVYYRTAKTTHADAFKFTGFGIIITNDEFDPARITVHQKALLDRVTELSIDLEPEDMFIYNTYLVEQFVNAEDLSNDEIAMITNLYNNEIRRWTETKAFATTGINYSIRLVQKMVDSARLFGESWKELSTTYKKLQAAADTYESINDFNATSNMKAALLTANTSNIKVKKIRKTRSDKGKRRIKK